MDRNPAPLAAEDLATCLRPFGQSKMLPRAAYVDPVVLEWERAHFFDGGWVCAGRLDELSEPTAQKAIRIGATGVLLTRDRAGELHAFANICRHRGHELLPCGARTVRGVVQCPYHAWSYELDGSLRLAPHFGDVPSFDPGSMGLLPVRHAEWGGWVFVNVDGAAGPFEDHLGGFGTLAAAWECERLRARRHPRVRAGGQLEDRDRELPRVLPLPAHPSRAVPGVPQRLGPERADRARACGWAATWSWSKGPRR